MRYVALDDERLFWADERQPRRRTAATIRRAAWTPRPRAP